MIHILMRVTRRGTQDGFHVRVYRANQTYKVSRLLAARFLHAGHATHFYKTKDLKG